MKGGTEANSVVAGTTDLSGDPQETLAELVHAEVCDALSKVRRRRNHVDDGADGVLPVHGRPRSVDDLDPFGHPNAEVAPQHHLFTAGRIHSHPVQQKDDLVVTHDAPDGNQRSKLGEVEVDCFHTRHVTKNIAQVGVSTLANILFRDEVHRRWDFKGSFGRLGRASHLGGDQDVYGNVSQFLDVQIQQVRPVLGP